MRSLDAQEQASHTDTPPESRFPCKQCGAVLKFSPGSGTLKCEHCGQTQAIATSARLIEEHDFPSALRKLAESKAVVAGPVAVKCTTCAADFQLQTGTHAGECPYCGAPVVVDAALLKHFEPESLLPFTITQARALQSFRQWLGSRWFAPTSLKKYASSESHLKGIFVPYWTYDSKTESTFSGMRGDIYYVRENYVAIVNGRQVMRSRQVPRIRWTSVRGRVQRHFDDVLVGASGTLSRQITDRLVPWDLHNLVPLEAAYLSGFSSEVYQVDLETGFEYARLIMDQTIRADVRRRIGGDQQQITDLRTQHSDTRFKSLLLPVWTAAFRFRGKVYRFVVNGRTGNTQGERPYSYFKIVLAAVLLLGLVGGGIYLLVESGVLENLQSTYYY